MDSENRGGAPQFDLGQVPAPKPPNRQGERRESFAKKVIVTLASIATIVGGVAAGFQVYEYATNRKPESATTSSGGNPKVEPDPYAWKSLSAGNHFQIKVPPTWYLADRTTFESSMSMASPGTDFAAFENVLDRQYLMSGPNESALGCQLFLMENRDGSTAESLKGQFESLVNGPSNGFTNPDRTTKIENVSTLDTMSGSAVRIIASYRYPEEPDRIVAIANLFFCPRKDAVWMAMFFAWPGDEIDAAATILPIVQSIELID